MEKIKPVNQGQGRWTFYWSESYDVDEISRHTGLALLGLRALGFLAALVVLLRCSPWHLRLRGGRFLNAAFPTWLGLVSATTLAASVLTWWFVFFGGPVEHRLALEHHYTLREKAQGDGSKISSISSCTCGRPVQVSQLSLNANPTVPARSTLYANSPSENPIAENSFPSAATLSLR